MECASADFGDADMGSVLRILQTFTPCLLSLGAPCSPGEVTIRSPLGEVGIEDGWGGILECA